MPCDTRISVGLDLKAADAGLLAEAIKEMGLGIRVGCGIWSDAALLEYCKKVVQSGRVAVLEGAEGLVARIQQAYAAKVIESTAKRHGWQVKKTQEGKYQMLRR